MIGKIQVEVAYANGARQVIIPIAVEIGTTASQAILASRIAEQFPEIASSVHTVGIFGKVIRSDAVLREGDRVEIYRPLITDPKEVRRRRAKGGRR